MVSLRYTVFCSCSGQLKTLLFCSLSASGQLKLSLSVGTVFSQRSCLLFTQWSAESIISLCSPGGQLKISLLLTLWSTEAITVFCPCSGQLKIPSHISKLHVEQEVTGDETKALQSVLECDEKREGLLKLERELNQQISCASTK